MLQGPTSFVYYVVSRLGPHGEYYALAVALRNHEGGEDFCGIDVVNACLGITKILSSAPNTPAIDAELLLAKDFYSGTQFPIERVYPPILAIPSATPSPEVSAFFGDLEEEEGSGDTPDWEAQLSQIQQVDDQEPLYRFPFPFISTCLQVGLGYDAQSHTANRDTILKPLGFTLSETLDSHGLAVIDITDLANIRQGILAFNIPQGSGIDSDLNIAVETGPNPLPSPVEDWSRKPLGPRAYMEKFGYIYREGTETEVEKALASWRDVESAALDSIWPNSTEASADSSLTHGGPIYGLNSLASQSLGSLIQGTHHTELYEDAELRIPLLLDFASSLRQRLELEPKALGPQLAAGQLLGVAYAGVANLNWARFTGTSYRAVAYALEQPGMQAAQSLSLCISDFLDEHVDVFLQSLLKLPQLRHICLLRHPARIDEDDADKRVFHRLAHHSGFLALLGTTSIMLTTAYLAGLLGERWLSTEAQDRILHFGTYPIQQVLARLEIMPPRTPGKLNYKQRKRLERQEKPLPKFSLKQLDFGGSMLTAERFASGLLSFVSARCRDDLLLSFSQAPVSLQNMASQSTGPLFSRNPAAAEVSLAADTPAQDQVKQLRAGTWTAIVSCQGPSHGNQDTPFIGYALVYSKRHISPSKTGAELGSDDIVVCNLQEFLASTCPRIDSSVIAKGLLEANETVDAKNRYQFDADWDIAREQWVIELDEATARGIIADFLGGAAFS